MHTYTLAKSECKQVHVTCATTTCPSRIMSRGEGDVMSRPQAMAMTNATEVNVRRMMAMLLNELLLGRLPVAGAGKQGIGKVEAREGDSTIRPRMH